MFGQNQQPQGTTFVQNITIEQNGRVRKTNGNQIAVEIDYNDRGRAAGPGSIKDDGKGRVGVLSGIK